MRKKIIYLCSIPKTKEAMSKGIEDFFLYSNAVHNVTEEEYKEMELLVSAVKSFARITYKCVYVIDYFKRDFVYVSDNFAYLCGQDPELIKEFGYRLYSDFVPSDERRMLVEINRSGFDFFEKIPVGERKEWAITYDFHIVNGNHKRLINHKLTPISLTKDGRMWLGLCTISLSAKNKPGNVIMKKSDDSSYYEYSFSDHRWHKKEQVKLSEEERNVLIFSSQGYTMAEIAELIYKSVDTVKSYKRRIFEKFEVNNITEAVMYAINYKLL